MIALQSLLFTALGGYAALGDQIGTRVYPDVAPQGTAVPYCTWQEFALIQANDIGGSAETGGLNNHRIQITSWARGPKGGTLAREIDANVRLAMIAASGFKSLLIDSRALDYEPETKLHGYQSDFSIWLKT